MKKWIFIISVLLLGSGWGMWHYRHRAQAKRSTPQAPIKEEPVWDWSKYPQTDRFLLGNMRSDLEPVRIAHYAAPIGGTLTLLIQERESFLPKGTLFALLNEQQLQTEERNMEISEKTLELKERWARTMERPQQRLKVEKETDEARRKLELLRIVTQDPDLKALTAEFGDTNIENIDASTLERAEEEFAILEAHLAAIKGEGDLGTFDLELESKRLEFESRKADFARKRENAQYKTNFDGNLQISHSLNINDEVDTYPVGQGQRIAVLRDLSELQFIVALNHPSWLQLPKERLEAVVYNAQGRGFKAAYKDQRIEPRGTSEIRHYVFLLPKEESEAALNLIGSNPQAEVWFLPETPVYAIPKTDVALHARNLAHGRRWDEVVSSLFPGAQLIAEGQTHLAIFVPQNPKNNKVAD